MNATLPILDRIMALKAADPQATTLCVGENHWETLFHSVGSSDVDPRIGLTKIYGLRIQWVTNDPDMLTVTANR